MICNCYECGNEMAIEDKVVEKIKQELIAEGDIVRFNPYNFVCDECLKFEGYEKVN